MIDDTLHLKGLKFRCTNQSYYYGLNLVIGKIYKAEGSRKAGDAWNPTQDRICVGGVWYGLLNFEPVEVEVIPNPNVTEGWTL